MIRKKIVIVIVLFSSALTASTMDAFLGAGRSAPRASRPAWITKSSSGLALPSGTGGAFSGQSAPGERRQMARKVLAQGSAATKKDIPVYMREITPGSPGIPTGSYVDSCRDCYWYQDTKNSAGWIFRCVCNKVTRQTIRVAPNQPLMRGAGGVARTLAPPPVARPAVETRIRQSACPSLKFINADGRLMCAPE